MTPLGSLAFQYAEGIKGFNSQKGLFDVAIEGDATATAFKLTSRLITNTLTQLDTSGSTLSVGVDYNGAAVEKTGDTVMIDTANGVLGGNLSALANGYNASGRIHRAGWFHFLHHQRHHQRHHRSDRLQHPAGRDLERRRQRPVRRHLDQLILLMHQQGAPLLFTDGIVMKKHLLALGLLLVGVSPAQALDVGDISSFYEQRQQHAEQNNQEQHRQRSTDQYPSRTALFPAGWWAGYPDG